MPEEVADVHAAAGARPEDRAADLAGARHHDRRGAARRRPRRSSCAGTPASAPAPRRRSPPRSRSRARRRARAARCSGRRCRSCAPSSRCCASIPASVEVSLAGSARRMRETVRDLDIIATATDPQALVDYFCSLNWVVDVAAKGTTKATVVSHDGAALRPARRPAGELRQPAAALHRLEEPQRRAARGRRPSRLLRLRVLGHRGRDGRGASLRARGGRLPLPRLRLDPAGAARGRRRARRGAQRTSCRRSSSSPTCAATCTRTRPGRTARTRSRTWSPQHSAAATPTTRSATTRSGCAATCLHRQSEQIDALNELVAPFRILKGIEVNIRPDGTLDVVGRGARDARLGGRVGALALRPRSDRARAARRWRARTSTASAIRRAAGSASARRRRSIVERVIEKALETGTFLELNSQPDRLDLSDVHARAAREAGLKLVIDSDGHQIGALDYVELGVGQARRAWLTKRRRREHAHVEADREAAEEAMTFREDLDRASDWADAYLRRVGELPVAADVEPGAIRARLPDVAARARRAVRRAAPRPRRDHPAGHHALEPPALLRVVREHRLRAGDPRRAPDRGAERQRHDVARLARRDRARGDGAGLARAAPRAAAGLARPHRGHRVDRDGRGARRGADAQAGRRRLRVRAGELQRREGRAPRRARVPEGGGRRRVPHAHATSRSTMRPRSSRPSARPARRRSTPCPSSHAAATTRACGCTSTPRTPARPRCAPSSAGASTASSAPIRSSSTRTSGSSRRWTARRSGRAGPRRSTRRSRSCPTTSRRREAAIDLKDYGPALGRRFRALKLWAVLRWYGAEGLRALIREHVRLAQLFASLVEAEPGWEVAAPHPFSTVCFRHRRRRQRRDRARGDRDRRALRRDDAAARAGRDPPRDRQRADDRGRHPPHVGGAAACAIARSSSTSGRR